MSCKLHCLRYFAAPELAVDPIIAEQMAVVESVEKNYVYSSAVKYPACIRCIGQNSRITKVEDPFNQFPIKKEGLFQPGNQTNL